MRYALTFLLLFTATSALAQQNDLQKLDWLLGEWQGEAWVRMGPAEPQHIVQTEKVQKKAGGDVLLVEGLGRDKSGKVVHDALGLVWWDAQKKQVRFNAVAAGRGVYETTMEVGDKTAIWRMTTPQGGQIRYTMRLTEKGEWNEIGEFSRDNGSTWTKFMEMTLTKTSS